MDQAKQITAGVVFKQQGKLRLGRDLQNEVREKANAWEEEEQQKEQKCCNKRRTL